MAALAQDAIDRLQELREEYAAGMRVMAEMRARQEELRIRLLRISGAVQMLEELLGEAAVPASAGIAG